MVHVHEENIGVGHLRDIMAEGSSIYIVLGD